jgi:hypothetical protein
MAKTSNKDYGRQAFTLLKTAFILVPIIAGLDKFFNLLTNWAIYLSPMVLKIINFRGHGFMMIVGIIEIIAGIGVIFKPKLFSQIIAIWLALIILNLLIKGMFYDIALRDFGLFLSAIALSKLSPKYA